MPAILAVQARHAEDVISTQAIRGAVIGNANFTLPDLAKLDLRLEAHIDGLRIAGDEGWTLVRRELAWRQPGEVFAASVLALDPVSVGHPERLAEVFALIDKKPALAKGLISALGWLLWPQAEPHARRLASSSTPWKQRAGIAAFAIHRQDPDKASFNGPHSSNLLQRALTSEDRSTRARAARAAGELGRVDLVPYLQDDLTPRKLSDAEPATAEPRFSETRFSAAWSTALLAGYTRAVEVLQEIASAPNPYQQRALSLALRCMRPHDALVWQAQLARTTPRLGLIAAGVIGDPALIPGLLDHMAEPALARVTGEAFTSISGVDLAYQSLDRRKPEDFESGPSEDPADADVGLDPDDRLPWPEPTKVNGWWQAHKTRFQPGTRHLLGQPITRESLQGALRTGKQRQRAAAALELVLLDRGQPLFETRAPGFRQQQMLR